MATSNSGSWNSASPAPAVLRASAVLDFVATSGRRGASVAEIAGELGLPRSSTANVCAALVEVRLLNLVDGMYVLGHHLVELSGYYLAAADPIQRFNDYCRLHAEVHGYTLHLATLDGIESMNVGRSYGREAVVVAPRVGQHLPANCTALGKAMLAQHDDDYVRELLIKSAPLPRLTPMSKVDVDEVFADIQATRERGYGINDEETYVGVYGLAVAVQGLPSSEGPYAVSCSTLKSSSGDDRVGEMLEILREVAAAVSGGH